MKKITRKYLLSVYQKSLDVIQPKKNCLDSITIANFVIDRLSEKERKIAEEHILRCESCFTEVINLKEDIKDILSNKLPYIPEEVTKRQFQIIKEKLKEIPAVWIINLMKNLLISLQEATVLLSPAPIPVRGKKKEGAERLKRSFSVSDITGELLVTPIKGEVDKIKLTFTLTRNGKRLPGVKIKVDESTKKTLANGMCYFEISKGYHSIKIDYKQGLSFGLELKTSKE